MIRLLQEIVSLDRHLNFISKYLKQHLVKLEANSEKFHFHLFKLGSLQINPKPAKTMHIPLDG